MVDPAALSHFDPFFPSGRIGDSIANRHNPISPNPDAEEDGAKAEVGD